MTKTKKELTKAQEFEMFMLGISYKHDNEITLCIDDVWEHIQSLLKQQREEAIEIAVRWKAKYNITGLGNMIEEMRAPNSLKKGKTK